jgi:hypothetical protein
VWESKILSADGEGIAKIQHEQPAPFIKEKAGLPEETG